MALVAPVPRHEMPERVARNLLEKAVCFIASAEKDGAAAAARDENSKTDALSRGTVASGYGTAMGEELDCYTAGGEDDGDEGSSSDRSASYVTRDGGTASNFPSTAVLQYERVDDDGGCVIVVECIALAVASVWGLPVLRPAWQGGGPTRSWR